MTIYAKSLTQAIQRLNANPYNLTKDECIQVVRELRTELEAMPAEPKDQTQWDRVYALIRHWSQRAQAAESALGELVAVKALKDDAEKLHFVGPLSTHGEGWKAVYEAQRAEYIRRQPVAWEVARDVLTKAP